LAFTHSPLWHACHYDHAEIDLSAMLDSKGLVIIPLVSYLLPHLDAAVDSDISFASTSLISRALT
jgi:hypothetical protein